MNIVDNFIHRVNVLNKRNVYILHNTALRSVFPCSFTLSKLPSGILPRLVLLVSTHFNVNQVASKGLNSATNSNLSPLRRIDKTASKLSLVRRGAKLYPSFVIAR